MAVNSKLQNFLPLLRGVAGKSRITTAMGGLQKRARVPSDFQDNNYITIEQWQITQA